MTEANCYKRCLEAIVNCDWFEGIAESELETLARHAKIKLFQIGDYVYSPGQPKTHAYAVLSGKLRRSLTSAQGQEVALVDQIAGDWIADAVPSDSPLQLDAVAIEASEILLIHRNHLLELAERHLIVYRNLYHLQAISSRKLLDAIESLAFNSLKSRLAMRFLALAEQQGEESEGGITITQNLSQNDLALLSFGSRPKVNRILKEWIERNIITVDSMRYSIVDMDALSSEIEVFDH